ncbi:MAG TPA: nuclear transport factor 2 family protein [Candidatus Binatia bacterium]|nr:nuclear transport factor 2 family protein [Candidatus Binatia bacterium]
MSQLTADDRLAIGELLAAYCQHLDLGEWDAFCALFTEDARLDFGRVMGTHEGRAGIRAFADTMKGLGLFMRHYVTNVVITGDGERARARSYVLALTGQPGQQSQTTGLYDDELVKVNGRWLLRARRALLDVPPA